MSKVVKVAKEDEVVELPEEVVVDWKVAESVLEEVVLQQDAVLVAPKALT